MPSSPDPKRSKRFVALIPALDSEDTIPEIVRGCVPFVAEVVVVDDGSSDATGARAAEAGATVLRHPVNKRKGAALKTGFAYALGKGYEAVVTLDADGQHLPSEIPRFIEAFEQSGADLIIGDRSHLFEGMIRRRRLANQFSARTISFAAGSRVDDSQSGFRLYSARLIAGVSIKADGFDAESEVIVRAGRAGMKIVMLPIALGFVDGLRTSHYRAVGDTLQIAWTVLKTLVRG